eukprot:CAMPEP_0116103754 /NCGR_PEP_ID=MMETSP0327-20121206/14057_1 /TAXON_ID=44447 /ORGANISM="Pseudo-nitzschia delicatissima, Strain B596" /LENGTH=504 /DNA_ID=CAMNT_0003595893 /DNA_START=68 /DNA_END=1582 /DNA_ORIENTATION=-
MNSKQNNTVPDAEKQMVASSTTLKIFDEKIDASEKQEPQNHNPSSMKPNILADASNKVETQQQVQVGQNMSKKKKKGSNHKKKWKKNQNKKKNGTANARQHIWANQNPVRDAHHCDNYHTHQEFLPHEEANMLPNPMGGFPAPFQGYYIPGSQHTFPIPHPQQHHQHIFADDGDAKVLLESNGDGHSTGDGDSVFNNNRSVNGTKYYNWLHSPLPWQYGVNMIDNSTQVEYVVLTHNGESELVQIPPNVGFSLKKELLVQKESFNIYTNHSNGYHNDRNAYAQGRPGRQGNINTSGSSVTSLEHQAGGIPYSAMPTSGHPHQYPNNHPDYSPPYGTAVNQYQPYNGYGTVPHPGNNEGMHIAPPAFHPMMQQQGQHPAMQFSQYQGMPKAITVGTIPGYTHPNGFQPIRGEATQGENPDKAGEQANEQPSNDGRNIDVTPNRARINQNDVVENGNHPNVRNQNQREATPHRGAMRGNGRGDFRRVSISPVGPYSQTPVTRNGNM